MACSDRSIWSQALHELRNSLSVVQMVLERLGDPTTALTADRFDRYLQRAQISSEQMEKLMIQLTQLETLSHNQLELKCDRHSIADLTTYVSQQIAVDPVMAYAHRNIRLIKHCAADASWYGDREILWQGLQPILHNALQYQPESVPIQLIWQASPDCLMLEIQDSGPGIDPSDRPHLFEPFYRGKAGQQSGHQGFGMGLAIAEAAISLCEGEIAFHALTPQGSSCRVTFHPPIG